MKQVSVIIPAYNEQNYIQQAIESLLANDYPRENLEIIVIDGNSTDQTAQIVKNLQKKHPNIKLLHNPGRITPISLNMGIRAAKGQIIIRADAHALYPENYISTLVTWLERLKAANVGGVFSVLPEKTPPARAIATILSSVFGVGNALYRLKNSGEPVEVDTVPYGCWNREIFNKTGYFNEQLARNQDIELNKRIKQAGGKIFLLPWLKIFYIPRKNFSQFIRYAFKTGLWNILTVFYTKTVKSLSLRHFVPLFFTLSLIFLPLAAIFYRIFLYLLVAELVTYFALAAYFAFKDSKKFAANPLLVIPGFFLWHFFYGLGELSALARLPFLKQKIQ